LNRDWFGRQAARVDPGKEAAAATASAARLKAQAGSVHDDLRIGSEAPRVADPEPKLRPRQVHVFDLHTIAGKVRGKREAGGSGELRVIDDSLVDRPLPALRRDRRRQLGSLRRKRKLTHYLAAAGDALSAVDDRVRCNRAIRDDEHRSRHGLRAAPPFGNRACRLFGLSLAVVDKQPDGKERDRQSSADQDRQQQFEARRSFAFGFQHGFLQSGDHEPGTLPRSPLSGLSIV
jgi:hypothetical protein